MKEGRSQPCTYCGDSASGVDHIIPKAYGGTDDPANLTPSCWPCNSKKGTLPAEVFRLSGRETTAWLLSKGWQPISSTQGSWWSPFADDRTFYSRAAAIRRAAFGVPWSKENAFKDKCPQGHFYDDDNTYTPARGDRQCRTCMRDRARRRYVKTGYPQSRRIECPRGHPYDEQNTKLYRGRRVCRTCDNGTRPRRNAT